MSTSQCIELPTVLQNIMIYRVSVCLGYYKRKGTNKNKNLNKVGVCIFSYDKIKISIAIYIATI